VGEIKLRLDLLGTRPGMTHLFDRRSLAVSAKVLPHLFRFVGFN